MTAQIVVQLHPDWLESASNGDTAKFSTSVNSGDDVLLVSEKELTVNKSTRPTIVSKTVDYS